MTGHTATVVHGSVQLLLLACGVGLLGQHVALYGFRRGFVEPSNRGRMYATLVLIALSAVWSEMFPSAKQVSSNIQAVALASAGLVFIVSYGRARRAWRPFAMASERHVDPLNGFSIGLPKGWKPVPLTGRDIAKNYVFSIGTPDKQAMVAIACRRDLGNPERWKQERLEEFERHRQRFENPTPMRAPDYSSTAYPPLGADTDILYRRFAAERIEYPKMCTERFIFVHHGAGYVIDHFVTGRSDAEIGAILGTWQFENNQPEGAGG